MLRGKIGTGLCGFRTLRLRSGFFEVLDDDIVALSQAILCALSRE